MIFLIEEAERLLAVNSFIEENDDDDNSSQTTIVNPGEALICNASHSAHTKGDEENGIEF